LHYFTHLPCLAAESDTPILPIRLGVTAEGGTPAYPLRPGVCFLLITPRGPTAEGGTPAHPIGPGVADEDAPLQRHPSVGNAKLSKPTAININLK